MPFDSPNYAARYAPATPADDTPFARRRTLIAALRAEDLAQRWAWDFSFVSNSCGTAGCAIGLAVTIWPDLDDLDRFDNVVNALGLDEKTGNRIFNCFDRAYGYNDARPEDVTPAMVADALEATLPESER